MNFVIFEVAFVEGKSFLHKFLWRESSPEVILDNLQFPPEVSQSPFASLIFLSLLYVVLSEFLSEFLSGFQSFCLTLKFFLVILIFPRKNKRRRSNVTSCVCQISLFKIRFN